VPLCQGSPAAAELGGFRQAAGPRSPKRVTGGQGASRGLRSGVRGGGGRPTTGLRAENTDRGSTRSERKRQRRPPSLHSEEYPCTRAHLFLLWLAVSYVCLDAPRTLPACTIRHLFKLQSDLECDRCILRAFAQRRFNIPPRRVLALLAGIKRQRSAHVGGAQAAECDKLRAARCVMPRRFAARLGLGMMILLARPTAARKRMIRYDPSSSHQR
jgi:hypothetical protein